MLVAGVLEAKPVVDIDVQGVVACPGGVPCVAGGRRVEPAALAHGPAAVAGVVDVAEGRRSDILAGGHGVYCPIQHQAQPGMPMPIRHVMLVEGLPGGLPRLLVVDGLNLFKFRLGPFHLVVGTLRFHVPALWRTQTAKTWDLPRTFG